jgi:hypothetical protein
MIWHHHETIIRDLLVQRGLKRVLEVGVAYGDHTLLLARSLAPTGGHLTSIDPRIPLRLRVRLWRRWRHRFIQQPSLDVLPRLASAGERFDCAILDGDHNWYTVFHELKLLAPMMTERGIILLHDVAWPYARRDLYYAPERVPPEFRHPSDRRPIIEGQRELGPKGGPGMNPDLLNALHEGGPRNGVLTAVEDFVTAHTDRWQVRVIQSYGGLGILEQKVGARTTAPAEVRSAS